MRDGVAKFFGILDPRHAGADRIEDTVGLRWPDGAAKSSIGLTDKAVQTIAIWVQETGLCRVKDFLLSTGEFDQSSNRNARLLHLSEEL